MGHAALELVADAELVVHHHLAQVVDAPLQLLQPHRCPGQAVGGQDVEHEEPVDIADGGVLVDVAREQVGVAGVHAAVAADVQVVAVLGGDEAEVLALGLGALAHAARHRRLDLVRGADAPVALFDPDRELHRVLHPEPAPRGADAALHRAQGLAVGVAALEPGSDQLLPDVGQLVELGPEHVDALPAGDLGEEAVLLGDGPQRNELVGGDFAPRHPGDDRVDAAALHVGEEAVVRVLQGLVGVVEDVLVPQAREHRADRGLADLAAVAAAVPGDEVGEGPDLLHLDDVEQLLPRVREVLAEIRAHRLARRLELLLEEVGHQREAAAAAGARARLRLHVAHRPAAAGADGRADVALAHPVALADLGLVGHGGRRHRHPAGPRAEHEGPRLGRQLGPVLREHHKAAVVGRVADEDAADEPLAVGAEQQLLVDAAERVLVGERLGGVRAGLVVAEARHVDAHQLELRRQVGAREDARLVAGEPGAQHLGHLVAGGDETVDHAPVMGDLADGVDVGVAGLEVVVHDDPAALGHREPAPAGQLVAGADAGGDDDHPDLEVAAAVEGHPLDLAVAEDRLRRGADPHADPERLDLLDEQPRPRVVHLPRHQPGHELDDVGLEAEVVGGLGRLEPEQPPADDGGALDALGVGDDRLEVLDGAVDEDAPLVDAGNRRHEGGRAGGQHHPVVGNLPPPRRPHDPGLAVDGRRPVADVQLDPPLGVPLGLVSMRRPGSRSSKNRVRPTRS